MKERMVAAQAGGRHEACRSRKRASKVIGVQPDRVIGSTQLGSTRLCWVC